MQQIPESSVKIMYRANHPIVIFVSETGNDSLWYISPDTDGHTTHRKRHTEIDIRDHGKCLVIESGLQTGFLSFMEQLLDISSINCMVEWWRVYTRKEAALIKTPNEILDYSELFIVNPHEIRLYTFNKEDCLISQVQTSQSTNIVRSIGNPYVIDTHNVIIYNNNMFYYY